MKRADIVVIGAGIAGISAAARLSEAAHVVVLEAEPVVGYHATGRSAAVFIRNYGNDVLRVLNVASQPYLEGGDYLHRRGELLLALPDQVDLIEQHLDRGETIKRLDADAVVDKVPILKPGRFVGGAYEEQAYDIDVDRLLQSFLRTFRHNGGTVETNSVVTSMSFQNGVWRIKTAAGEFEAPIVVNAAGAWADKVAQKAGVAAQGLRPLRRSAAIVPMPDHETSTWPLFLGIAEDWYAKPEAGQLMVSPADEDLVEPHDAFPDDMVLAEGIDRFEKSTIIEVKRVTHSWAGLRTFAPDRSPVVGFDGTAKGFFWLAGQGGYGVQTSPALSQLAADLCLGRPGDFSPEILERMSPSRTYVA